MTVEIGNTTLTNTFDYWRNRTNEMADAMSTKVVTVESNTAVGNAAISGTFTANVFSGNGSLLTSVDADTVGGNTVSTINSYTDSKAANAYSNAVSYTNTRAATAYSNATSYADTKAATAYSNSVSYAGTIAATAYSNAVSYAGTIAATAYSNSVSYTNTRAATAYSNAVSVASSDATSKASTAYSNSVSYVNSKTLSQATWQAGTSTTEALISPAKFKAGVDSLVTFTSTTVSTAYGGAAHLSVGQHTTYFWQTGANNPGQTPPYTVGTSYAGSTFGLTGTWLVVGATRSYSTYYSDEYGWWNFIIKRTA